MDGGTDARVEYLGRFGGTEQPQAAAISSRVRIRIISDHSWLESPKSLSFATLAPLALMYFSVLGACPGPDPGCISWLKAMNNSLIPDNCLLITDNCLLFTVH
jgi:hypothetical protein